MCIESYIHNNTEDIQFFFFFFFFFFTSEVKNIFILYLAVKLMSKMDKSDIFTAELILIFSLVIDISRYFHCRFWITSDVSIHLTDVIKCASLQKFKCL